MDEVSSTKQLASILPKLYATQLRHSARLGWLLRDGDIWWPDEQQATQICRMFCSAAARQLRNRRLDSEATVKAVLRLASFDPRFTASIPEGHMQLGRGAI